MNFPNISTWLIVNKLYLNITNLNSPPRKIELPTLHTGDSYWECADEFNVLGITINNYLNWKGHICKLVKKLSNIVGIMSSKMIC